MTQATTRETTNLLKKYLRQKYNVECTIKSSKYSGGSSLSVEYTLGPDARVVEKELNRLQNGEFNSMEDIYDYKNKAERGIVLDGRILETYKYVFVKQSIPAEFRLEIAKLISSKMKFGEIHECIEQADLYKNFSTTFLGQWDWSGLVHYLFRVRNFVTQDYSKISLINFFTPDGSMEHQVEYIVNGTVYNTSMEFSQQPAIKKASRPEVNALRVVDYSDKAIAVLGDSTEIKEELQELGGRWNPHLTFEGEKVKGWIFPKSRMDKVSDILIEYSQVA